MQAFRYFLQNLERPEGVEKGNLISIIVVRFIWGLMFLIKKTLQSKDQVMSGLVLSNESEKENRRFWTRRVRNVFGDFPAAACGHLVRLSTDIPQSRQLPFISITERIHGER